MEFRGSRRDPLPCSETMRGARQPLFPKWSVTLPERRRLDAERPQIHVSLAAVMYLIINGVLNRPQPGSLPHAKCLVHFAEAVLWNLWEFPVQLSGLLIPQAEKFAFAGWLLAFELFPLPCRHAFYDRHSHANELPSHLGKRPHATHRKLKKLVFRESLDRPARQPPVSLPVVHESVCCQHVHWCSLSCHFHPPCGPSGPRS